MPTPSLLSSTPLERLPLRLRRMGSPLTFVHLGRFAMVKHSSRFSLVLAYSLTLAATLAPTLATTLRAQQIASVTPGKTPVSYQVLSVKPDEVLVRIAPKYTAQ